MVKIFVMENTKWVGTFLECTIQDADIHDKVICIKFHPLDVWEHPNKNTYSSSSSSIDSTTLGGSWSVQQFYSTLVYPQSSPSSQ